MTHTDALNVMPMSSRMNATSRRPAADYHYIVVRSFILLATLISILLASFFISSSLKPNKAQAAQRATQTSYESIRIQEGDSLWNIAEEYCGTESVTSYVSELKELNNISSDTIHSGSYLLIPVTTTL